MLTSTITTTITMYDDNNDNGDDDDGETTAGMPRSNKSRLRGNFFVINNDDDVDVGSELRT